MSLTLWTVIAPTPKNKTLGAFTTRHRERMLLQSADDWALRLHSCRALSSTIATRSYNKSFHNEITVDKPHTRNLRIFTPSGSGLNTLSKDWLNMPFEQVFRNVARYHRLVCFQRLKEPFAHFRRHFEGDM